MSRLQRYIFGHTAKAFIPAFVALSLLMMVGFCMQLLHEGLDIVGLAGMLPQILTWCVPMLLPAAFLTAVIMAFGRLGADNELLAVRASGIHLYRVVHPVLAAALGLAVVAAYLQFEAQPRARGAVQALRYDALKQVLLNKAALSWKRSFSFPPVYIRYDDFVDGRMRRVLVLEARENMPRTLITAASAVIRSDPRLPGGVVFDMSHCVITRYGLRQAIDPHTMQSERVVYHLPVGPSAEDVLSKRKYLELGDLIHEFRRLHRVLAAGKPFSDPEEAYNKSRAERNRIDIGIALADAALSERRDKYVEAYEQEPRRQRQIIERSERIIADAQAGLADLQSQLDDCTAQLSELQGQGVDLDRVVTMQRQRATILKQIEARKGEIEDHEGQVRAARTRLDQCGATAAELAEEIRSLADQKAEREAQQRKVTRVMMRAAAQEDLQSLRIRVHKRLSQAASVFTFALLGIPLGIVFSRRSVMIAFGISFGIVLMVFYPFLIAGTIAAEAGALPVVPAIWAGNAFVFLLGGLLTVHVLGR